MASDIELGIEGLGPATLISRGGTAYVYQAEQLGFGRTVAVKVLFQPLEDLGALRRFERECRAIGAVSDHPNIVVVHDRGLTPDDRPYLVMEYRAGGSLADRLKVRGRLTEAEVVDVGIKVSRALEVAHQAGVIHRDVKPANILLSAYGEPALADFGIARIDGDHKTTHGVVTASIIHASREVLDGDDPDHRSDVYSMGSTLFELATGRAPYYEKGEESVWPLINRVLTSDPPDPADSGVSPPLAAVLSRAISHDPAARQQSAAELEAELQGLAADPAVVGPAATPAATTTVATPAGPDPTVSTADGSDETTQVDLPMVPPVDPDGVSAPAAGDGAPSNEGRPEGPSVVRAPGPVDGGRPRRGRRLLIGAILVAAVGAAALFAVSSSDTGTGDEAGRVSPEEATVDSTTTTEVDPERRTEATIDFAQSEIGPLTVGRRYALRVRNAPDEARYRLVVGGEPVTDWGDAVPVYFPTAGRHQLQVEIDADRYRAEGGDETLITEPVEIYVSDGPPQPGFRANLASVRSVPSNWPRALAEYDSLVAQGHERLELSLSTRDDETDELPFWNFYVEGFGDDRSAAQAYCDRFELDNKRCFVAEIPAA